MLLFHRTEAETLRAQLSAPGPALATVCGPRRIGKTSLLRRVLPERPCIWFRGSPLPSALLAREHLARLDGDAPRTPRPADWATFEEALLGRARRGELDGALLVWDRADRLIADPRFRRMLEVLWTELRVHARPVQIVLISRDAPRRESLEFVRTSGAPPLELRLQPPGLRDATGGFLEWSPLERVTAFALFGGEPTIWDRFDPQVRLSTNVIRLLLEPGAPLRGYVRERFPVPGRNPQRSLALVDALARGAREWGELKEEVGVFKSSSELGPYMKALRDSGLMESRRPLSAPPGGRRRRHLLTAPLLASWHALFKPALGDMDAGAAPGQVWKDRIRPRIGSVAARRLPDLLSDHLRRHGEERFRARAREVGGLWGEGPDIAVAATLVNGAVVYGRTSWEDPGPEAIDQLARQVTETRYGYGREARALVLFAALPVAWEVQRSVARRTDAVLLGPEALTGNDVGGGE